MPDDVITVWNRLCDTLRDAGRILVDPRAPTDPSVQAAGLVYLLNLLNSGMEMTVWTADPDHPEVGRPQDPFRRWALDCPDALYASTRIDGSGTYRLTFVGGTPHYLGISVTAGQLGTDQVRGVGNLASPGAIDHGPDGSIEVVLSPTEHDGNWIRTETGMLGVGIRQFFYDWDTEVAHRITIDRLDGSPAPPAASLDDVAAQFARLGGFVSTSTALWPDFVAGLAERLPNTIGAPNPQASAYGGTPDNVYGSGYFDLGPDEAAIIEVTPPPCHYWNMQFGDYWFQSLDYTYRQTSLNGFQAELDTDGVFRGVLAHQDPGVANWLDTAGNRIVPMTYRWQLSPWPAEQLPTPTARVVPFAEVEQSLPATTRRVATAERRETLERRRRAVLRRFGRG